MQESLFQGEKALFTMLIEMVFWHYLESRNTMFRLGPISGLKMVSIWEGSKYGLFWESVKMGHLPFEKWVFYGGFRVGHGSRVRRGQNRASRRSWQSALLVLGDGFAKSCFRGAILVVCLVVGN